MPAMPALSRAPIRVAVGLLVAGLALALVIGGFLPRWWIGYFDGLWGPYDPAAPFGLNGLRKPEVLGSLRLTTLLVLGLGGAGFAGILWGLFGRSRWALFWTHAAFVSAYLAVTVCWFAYGSFLDAADGGNLIAEVAQANAADPRLKLPAPVGLRGLDYFQSTTTLVAVGLVLALVVSHVACATGTVYRHHGEDLPGPAPGDRLKEFVRIGGEDPRWAGSVYVSVFGHLLVIFLPLLLSLIHGCGRERYDKPAGSGKPAAPPVTAPKIVKKKRFVLVEDSIFIWRDPTPNDSKVVKNIDIQSQNIYTATASGTPGALGEGGGDDGGYGGPPGGILRFIRLEWNCHKWYDGMDARTGNADRNFLRWYKRNPVVKFKVASTGEKRTILQMHPKRWDPGATPPFVYMTGEGKGRVSSAEVEALQEYLKSGGLLLVDAGSSAFHSWFISWVRCLTNNKGLVEISDDDDIFNMCYRLDNIDPLFSHSGRKNARAMGYKYDGRWVIFYHPGDMNDAWKDSATGVKKRLRENARYVAFNVIDYAMRKHNEVNRKYQKK